MKHRGMWPSGRAYHTTCCVSPSLCVVIGGWVERESEDSDGVTKATDSDAYVIDMKRGTAHKVS